MGSATVLTTKCARPRPPAAVAREAERVLPEERGAGEAWPRRSSRRVPFGQARNGRSERHGSEAPGVAAPLLLCVTRQPAEEVWEIFSVGTVLH